MAPARTPHHKHRESAMTRRIFATLLLAAATPGPAHAQTSDVIRIGVLNDLSSVYSDYQGMGSVIAARMAVEDYGGKAAGKRVEIVFGDHQNKVDIGANIARNWVDTDGVSLIVDAPNSAVAFAVSDIVRDRNKVFIG